MYTIELPCQVGQTIYYISHIGNKVDTDVVKFFTITKAGVKTILLYHNRKFWDYHKWGKDVFLSEEEAIEALKRRLQNDM